MNNIGKVYYTRKEAVELLGIHNNTIAKLRNEGKIEVMKVGTRHLYNVNKYIKDNTIKEKTEIDDNIENEEIVNEKKKICYCRVSSHNQKIELENQINYMKEKYPDYEILSDIGSGINFKRPNFIKILNYAINNQLDELVVAYKDRLCRISYDLIEMIFETYSNAKIIIVNDDESKSPEKEVTEDLIEIITVFSPRLYGLRKY